MENFELEGGSRDIDRERENIIIFPLGEVRKKKKRKRDEVDP